MAISIHLSSVIVVTLGIISFIFGVIAENKKVMVPCFFFSSVFSSAKHGNHPICLCFGFPQPAAGIPHTGKGVVICHYPSAPTVALGYLATISIVIQTVVGFMSLFYPYKGKAVPKGAFLESTRWVVFVNVAL